MKTRSAMLVISETLYCNNIKILTEGKNKQQRMTDWFPVFRDNTAKQFARKRSSGSSRIKHLKIKVYLIVTSTPLKLCCFFIARLDKLINTIYCGAFTELYSTVNEDMAQ